MLVATVAVAACVADDVAREAVFSTATRDGAVIEVVLTADDDSDPKYCVSASFEVSGSDAPRRELFSKTCFAAPVNEPFVTYSSVGSSAGPQGLGAALDVIGFAPSGSDSVEVRWGDARLGAFVTQSLTGAQSSDPVIFVISEHLDDVDPGAPLDQLVVE